MGEAHTYGIHDTLEPELCKMKRSKNHLLAKGCDCHVACGMCQTRSCSSSVEKFWSGHLTSFLCAQFFISILFLFLFEDIVFYDKAHNNYHLNYIGLSLFSKTFQLTAAFV